jgi:hypothetical protein
MSTAPKDSVDAAADIARRFCELTEAFNKVKESIAFHKRTLTPDARRMVEGWIDSSSAMILQAHRSLEGGGQG